MKHRVTTCIPLLALALLLLTLVGPLNASAASRPGARHISSTVRHFSALPAFIKHAESKSLNWSGYAAVKGHYTSVSAAWTQPSVTCSSKTTYSAFWVGLDGDGSNSVEQTGTEADCQGGRAVYSAWYEMYPKYPVTINHPVHPGDSMSASVTESGSSSFNLVISDSTQNWTYRTTQKSSTAKLASAEAIAEAPSSISGVLPLANFGTVNFSSTMVNGKSIGSFNPQEIVMETSGGTVKAQPSALSGGTAFSITWKHS